MGGDGSVTVAEGKAFVFVHWRHQGAKKIVITTKMLNDYGWIEGVPDDLATKVDAARNKRGKLEGEQLDAYIRAFVATVDATLADKYGDFIRKRISSPLFGWGTLVMFSRLRDKEFDSFEAISGATGDMLMFAGDAAYNKWRDDLLGSGYHYTDTIICLDANTGKELWTKEFPGVIPPPEMYMYIGASSTPAVWDGKCYAMGSAGFYCLNVKDGSVVWQARTGFSNSSPLIYKGVVYCCVPQLTAFDPNTGKVIWTADEKNMMSSVVPWNSGGKEYLVGCNFCLDPATGRNIWKGGPSVLSTPVINDGILVVGEGAGFKITPEGVTKLWTLGVHDNRGTSALIYKGYAYTTGSRYGTPIFCVDSKSGELQWTASSGTFSQGNSPLLADGKIIAQADDQDSEGAWTLMFRATPDKFEQLGRFHSGAANCTSPSLANRKLYMRLQTAVACWDIAEHRPYMNGVNVAKDELVIDFKQAEGGLTANGAIEGLNLADAPAKVKPVKAHLSGDSLKVDIKDVVFPIKISYAASGNLRAKNGPVAPFEWQSPALSFERCETNTLVMKFAPAVDPELWKSEKVCAIADVNITKCDLDWHGKNLRLTTDKNWKNGDKVTVRYPAVSTASSSRQAELSFTVTPGYPVTEVPLCEYLIGEFRGKIDPKTVFEHDDLDKKIKPVAGEKWKLAQDKGKAGLFQPSQYTSKGSDADRPALGHACVYVHAESDCKVQLLVGGYSFFQVVVNGQSVFSSPSEWFGAERGPPKEIKDVELKKGWNTVLLGLSWGPGGWCYFLSMRNEQGDGAPVGLRYTAELPKE
jgi:outer membrane protein assembly factor BamB